MKSVIVKASNNKDVKISLLTNVDLIYCIPVFIWNIVMHVVGYKIFGYFYKIAGYIGEKFLGDFFYISKWRVYFAVLVPMIFLSIIYIVLMAGLVSSTQAEMAITVIALVLLIMSGRLIINVHNMESFKPLGQCTIRDIMTAEAENVPEHILDSPHSRGCVSTGSIVTVYVLFNFVFLTLLTATKILYFAPFIAILQVFLYLDKENIEHMGSHAKGGKVIQTENASSIKDYFYVSLDFLRRYLVWPAMFWFPNNYFAIHTGVHHAENNGPADSQSTLRFDKSSFLGFIKAITWYSLFTVLIPFDAYRYLKAQDRKKFLSAFIRSYVFGYTAFIGMALLHPLLGLSILALMIGSGLYTYLFVMRWHGFHDASHPYSIEASNNSPMHYGHHKQQNVHVMAGGEACRLFWRNREKNTKEFPVYYSAETLEVYSRNWLWVFYRLWQGKFDVVRKLIYTDAETNSQLKKYVSGVKLIKENKKIRQLDIILSKKIGHFLENRACEKMSEEDRSYFYGKQSDLNINIRVTNFRRFRVTADHEELPQGLY